MNFKEYLAAGGPILIVLAAISVYSIAIIFERWNYYRMKLSGSSELGREVRRAVAAGDVRHALELARKSRCMSAPVLVRVLTAKTSADGKRNLASGAIAFQVSALQKKLAVLATVGSTTPFIGLFGTVLGVMRAFKDLSALSGAGPSVVATGIAEALVNTAAGLFVAIPAIFAYNYFVSKAGAFTAEMEWLCEDLIAHLDETRHVPPAPRAPRAQTAAQES